MSISTIFGSGKQKPIYRQKLQLKQILHCGRSLWKDLQYIQGLQYKKKRNDFYTNATS